MCYAADHVRQKYNISRAVRCWVRRSSPTKCTTLQFSHCMQHTKLFARLFHRAYEARRARQGLMHAKIRNVRSTAVMPLHFTERQSATNKQRNGASPQRKSCHTHCTPAAETPGRQDDHGRPFAPCRWLRSTIHNAAHGRQKKALPYRRQKRRRSSLLHQRVPSMLMRGPSIHR